jgi:hypothetical protein
VLVEVLEVGLVTAYVARKTKNAHGLAFDDVNEGTRDGLIRFLYTRPRAITLSEAPRARTLIPILFKRLFGPEFADVRHDGGVSAWLPNCLASSLQCLRKSGLRHFDQRFRRVLAAGHGLLLVKPRARVHHLKLAMDFIEIDESRWTHSRLFQLMCRPNLAGFSL